MAAETAQQVTGAETVVWDLSVFYSGVDDPKIEADMAQAKAMAEAFAAQYRGRVAALTPEQMAAALHEMEALEALATGLGVFAGLLYSTDTADPRIGALLARTEEFGSELTQMVLFFSLEWKAADDAAAQVILNSPAIGVYRHQLESDLRFKPYTLSEEQEQLLVEKSVTGRQAWTRLFTQLNAAMRFEVDGEQLNQSQVLRLSFSPDRETRIKGADAVTTTLREYLMQTTYIFNVLAADKASDDKRRGYPTWISSRNLANKASDEVVNALVTAVLDNYDIVQRHYRLKARLLGLDTLYEYDRYAPLQVGGGGRHYSWAEAREIVTSAYGAFSPEMGTRVNRFFDENWIHAALLPHKRGGAFAAPTIPTAHPFVLLNYTAQARDVATLAHELGHGLHMLLTAENQPLAYFDTPLTTAEMASVFGEMLVFEDLMRKEPDPAARLGMLASKLEDSFSTAFRQVSMNRFENGYHTARRTEGELSSDRLSEIWLESQRAMFGDSVTLSEDYGIWWSYIPHFLNTPGYVYAYAFGELLVLALLGLYRQRGAAFVPQYLDVLRAGGSDYPERILSHVGVDLNDPAFWQVGLQMLREMVAQEEALARQVFPDKF